MIELFQLYIETGLVKKVAPSMENSEALMARAHARLDYVRKQVISRETAPFVFEDVYEVLREASQALMELEGFKPYSHEAQIAFLRDIHALPGHLVSKLDRLRILRNKCVYGAASVSPETCGDALAFATSFLPELKKRFERNKKEGL